MKIQLLSFITLFTLISMNSYASEYQKHTPSMIDFARAAKAAYDLENSGFRGYSFLETYDEFHDERIPFNGFKINYFRSHDKKFIIAAVRGTENEVAFNENWYFNVTEIIQGSNLEKQKEKIAEIVVNPISKWVGARSKMIDGLIAGTAIYFLNKKRANSSLEQMSSSLYNVQKKYPDSKVYITGHSMGGFVAQFLSVMNHVSGFSFNAPGLGLYWNVLPKYEFEYKRQQFLQSDLWFQNHRLQGDAVSKINRQEGHLGSPIVSHRHNYWNQMHQESEVVTGRFTFLHDMGRLLEHLEEENCTNDGQFCSVVDHRPWSRKLAGSATGFD